MRAWSAFHAKLAMKLFHHHRDEAHPIAVSFVLPKSYAVVRHDDLETRVRAEKGDVYRALAATNKGVT